MKQHTMRHFACLDKTLNGNLPAATPHRFLPEKGVMLNADLPQLLGSSVVGKLEADCAFELLVLERRDEKNVKKGVGDTAPGELTLFC